jgi:hypothetical protein
MITSLQSWVPSALGRMIMVDIHQVDLLTVPLQIQHIPLETTFAAPCCTAGVPRALHLSGRVPASQCCPGHHLRPRRWVASEPCMQPELVQLQVVKSGHAGVGFTRRRSAVLQIPCLLPAVCQRQAA